MNLGEKDYPSVCDNFKYLEYILPPHNPSVHLLLLNLKLNLNLKCQEYLEISLCRFNLISKIFSVSQQSVNPAEAQSFTRGSVLHRLARCPWQLQVTTNKLQCLSRASTFAQTNISEAKKWDDRDSEDGERQLVLQHLAMSDRHRGGTHWTWAGLAILSFFIQIPKFGQIFFLKTPF